MKYFAYYRTFQMHDFSSIPMPQPPAKRSFSVYTPNGNRYKNHSVLILYGIGWPRRYFLWSVLKVDRIEKRDDSFYFLRGYCEDLVPPYEFKATDPNVFRELNRMWAPSSGLSEVTPDYQLYKRLMSLVSDPARKYNDRKAENFAFDLMRQYERMSQMAKVRRLTEETGYFDPDSLEDARQKMDSEIVKRQGQQAFRDKLLAAYEGRCAITGCNAEAALEAAHIREYLGPKTNHVQNGILLRADLHTLFDRRLLSLNPANWTAVLNPQIKRSTYSEFDGVAVSLPKQNRMRPNVKMMRSHYMETIGDESINMMD